MIRSFFLPTTFILDSVSLSVVVLFTNKSLIRVACNLQISGVGSSRSIFLSNFLKHSGVNWLFVDPFFVVNVLLTGTDQCVDEDEDIHNWVLSSNLLALRLLHIFFPKAVLPVYVHMDCVLSGPLGLR